MIQMIVIKKEEMEDVRLFLKSMTQTEIQMSKIVWAKWLKVLTERESTRTPLAFVEESLTQKYSITPNALRGLSTDFDYPTLNVWFIDAENHASILWMQEERGL